MLPSWKGQSDQSNTIRRHVRQQICHEEKRGPTSRPNKKITQNGRRHRSTYGTSISSFLLRETKSTTRPFPAVPSTETLPFPPHNSQPWSSLKYSSTVLSRFSFRSLSIIALDKSGPFLFLLFFFFSVGRFVLPRHGRLIVRSNSWSWQKKVRGRQIDRKSKKSTW